MSDITADLTPIENHLNKGEAAKLAAEARARCRLAWNNWPDTEVSRKEIAAHEARDAHSAASWDRVVESLSNFLKSASPPPQEDHRGGAA